MNKQSFPDQIQNRKDDHILICNDLDVSSGLTNGFEKYRFTYNALPDIDLDAVDLRSDFMEKTLSSPLLISAMTGGTKLGAVINRRLAKAAQRFNIAMGVGSQRAMINDSSLLHSYAVRDVAPDILLFANLGAIQLNHRAIASDHVQYRRSQAREPARPHHLLWEHCGARVSKIACRASFFHI